MSRFWHAHTHSHYSALDAMATVPQIVAKAAKMGQPAVSLTDHGTMAGAVELYTEAKKHGIAPFPGVEAYLLDPAASLDDKKPNRYHVGLLARNYAGYQALIKLVSLSHTRPRFARFPRITVDDLAALSEQASDDIILTTGCYFGLAQQALVGPDPLQAERVIKMYAGMFPHTLVELQHHNIVHDDDGEHDPLTDDDIVNMLVEIADRQGLPVIATQDSHYLNQTDKPAHNLLKAMAYGGVEDEFPGDAFHLATDEWVAEHYDQAVWERVEQTCDHVLSLHELTIPAMDTFKVHVPKVVDYPHRLIGARCNEALERYAPAHANDRANARYVDRLIEELGVINDLGMAGYFALVLNYVEWCNREGICIEARGSANGSLVCFLLGITQVDPIKWGTGFDRFLSRDRIKPPDIDMDVEDVARGRLLDYLRGTFDTLQIGTWSEMGLQDDGSGSILRSYQSYLAKQQDDPNERARIYATMQDIEDVKAYSRRDYRTLKKMADMTIYRSYGVHAAGLLLSGSDQRIDELVPSMLVASSNTTVSSYEADSLEALGYLKLDVLGQASLSVMRMCQELIGRDDPTDFTWIPDNDTEACKILREGRTNNGVFHYEAPAKARGGKQMGVRSTKDAILGSALFMPGAMTTGQTDLYLARRADKEARAKIVYPHPAFEKHLKPTHGALIFQEQAIDILRSLGMSIEGVNAFFKIVKSSGVGSEAANDKRLAALRAEFDRLCADAGIDDTDAAWHQIAGVGRYAFGKAHATGYGIRSYRTAYLKAHYPLEYMTALLAVWAGRDKETLYIREARRLGIRVIAPSVQSTSATYTLDTRRKAIRKPLVSIKGVGLRAATNIAENAPYTSIEDLIERTDSRLVTGGKSWSKDKTLNGVLGKLRDVGALDVLLTEEETA